MEALLRQRGLERAKTVLETTTVIGARGPHRGLDRARRPDRAREHLGQDMAAQVSEFRVSGVGELAMAAAYGDMNGV
eukprot:COSAG02_NODE_26_length_51927_cov_61.213881_30_plen_77_part_00